MNTSPGHNFADDLRTLLPEHTWTETRSGRTWTADSSVPDTDWPDLRTAADAAAAACGYPPSNALIDIPGDRVLMWAVTGQPTVYLMCAARTVVHTSIVP